MSNQIKLNRFNSIHFNSIQCDSITVTVQFQWRHRYKVELPVSAFSH